MTSIITYGLAEQTLENKIRSLITQNRPNAIGMATAFLSISGAKKYDSITKNCKAKKSLVIAGISGAITHPAALEFLSSRSHIVKICNPKNSIFHPKLLIGGNDFKRDGKVVSGICCYIGSANFTNAGLTKNIELGITTTELSMVTSAGKAFSQLWCNGIILTDKKLLEYETAFSKIINQRTVSDLAVLDILDCGKPSNAEPIVNPRSCNGVWAGLESYTGEHTFQVEFPRKAGEALSAILPATGKHASIMCADGANRNMTFKYYGDNGMYRLNVPNDMPLVDWARENRKGALLIFFDKATSDKKIHAKIIKGAELAEISERSKALGAIGQTTTRKYGWF